MNTLILKNGIRSAMTVAGFAMLTTCPPSQQPPPKIDVVTNREVPGTAFLPTKGLYVFKVHGIGFGKGDQVEVSILNVPGLGTVSLGTITVAMDEVDALHSYSRVLPARTDVAECQLPDGGLMNLIGLGNKYGTAMVSVVMRDSTTKQFATENVFVAQCDWSH